MREAPPGITLGVPRLAWGQQLLFENFRFRLDAGRWTCLLGPSGIGKTTLLRLLAGHRPGRWWPPTMRGRSMAGWR